MLPRRETHCSSPYLAAACAVVLLIEHGWPLCLYLLFFLFLVNAVKFGFYGIGRTLLALLRLPFRLAHRGSACRVAKRDEQQETTREYAAV